MERLSLRECSKVITMMLKSMEENQSLMDSGLCAYTSNLMTPREVLMRKYRIIKVISEMTQVLGPGLFEGLCLPEVSEVFCYAELEEDDLEYDDEWQCCLLNCLAELGSFGESYLAQCLQDTNWGVSYIGALEFYEELSEAVIKKCTESINFHWKALEDYTDGECTSDYLSSLGCVPESYYSFWPDCNVVMTNENIRQMIYLFEKDPATHQWPEYREFERLKNFSLFDRYYPSVSNPDFRDSDWECLNYMLGEVVHERVEETGFYQLNYEVVICLVMIDMIASMVLEKYRLKEGGCEFNAVRRAS